MTDPRNNPMLMAMRDKWLDAQAEKDRRIRELKDELKAAVRQLADCADEGRDALLTLREENTGLRLQLAKAKAILRRLAETEDLDELIVIANEAAQYCEEKPDEK